MKIFKNILRYGLWVCLFAVPFVPLYVANSMFFPFITGKNFLFRALVEIAFGLWAALAIVDVKYRPKSSWLLGAFFAFTAVITVADIYGVNSAKSIWSNYERMEGLVTVLHLFAYFLVLGSALNEKMWRWLAWTSCLAASIIGFMGLGQLSQNTGRIDATLGNSTYLGGYMLVHIFIVMYFFLRRVHISVKDVEQKWAAAWYVMLGAFYALVMYFTGTRGSLLGFLGGIFVIAIVLAIAEKKHIVIRKISIGLIAAVILLVVGLAGVRGTQFAKNHPLIDRFSAVATFDLKGYAESQGFARLTLWKMAWEGVKEKPLLGWGQDNFTYVFAKYYDSKMYTQEAWFDRTHNVFFDWLIAGGFLGLISYLSIFVAALWLLWKRDDFEIYERAVFTGLIVAYFIHNFFVFDNLTSYILIAIVLSYIHVKSAKEIPAFQKDSVGIEQLAMWAAVPLVLMPFVLVGINRPAYEANGDVLMALVYAQTPQVPSDVVMQKFKDALAQNSFGNKEIREQIISVAPHYMTKEVPQEKRKEWFNFAVSEAQKQYGQDHDARTLILLGSFYAQLGAFDNAIGALEEANKIFPNKPPVILMLSQIYAANKNIPKAKETLEKLLVLVPNYSEAQTLLAQISNMK
ncbi:MAG: O-antigen ligase family protein [bacterium]